MLSLHRPNRGRLLLCLASAAMLAACGSRLSQSRLEALNTGGQGGPADKGVVSQDQRWTGGDAPGTTGATGTSVPSGTVNRRPVGVGSATGGNAATAGSATSPGGGSTNGSGSTGDSGIKSDGKPITVCSVSEMSGPAGAALAQGVTGAQVWAADVNARGGIAGHKINLIVKDSGSDPQKALSQVRECVESQGAVALVASMSPLTNAGFRSYLESKRVPAIGGECGSATWNASPLFFSQCYATDTGFWALAAEAARAGASNKSFAFLYCQEAATCAESKTAIVDNGYAKANGLTVAYSKQISLTQLDFTSECSAMKAAGATTVDVVADPATLSRIGQSCTRQGYNPIYVQSQATVAADTQTKPGLKNLRVVLPAFPFCCLTGNAANNTAYRRYVSAWARYGGSAAPGPAATDGYSAALLFERFVLGVAKTAPRITSAALLNAASGIKNETLGGLAPPINFTAGKNTPDSRCWFVARAVNGGPWEVPDGLTTTCRR